MPLGDVGLVAKLLSEVFGFFTTETGYTEMSRESKLKWIRRGVNDAIETNNMAAFDALLAELRELRQQTGP